MGKETETKPKPNQTAATVETNQTPTLDIRAICKEPHKRDDEFRLDLTRADDDGRIPMTFSSENAVRKWWGWEILDHGPSARIDKRRVENGMNVLVNHNPDNYIGVLDDAELPDASRRGRGWLRGGPAPYAQEKITDIRAKVLTQTSFGYRTFADGAIEEGTHEDGTPVIRFMHWEPSHVSMVTDQGDTEVGAYRDDSERNEPKKEVRKVMADEPIKEPTPTPVAPVVDVKKVEQDARASAITAERERIGEIEAIAEKRPEFKELAGQFRDNGKPADEFRKAVFAKMTEDNPPLKTSPNDADIGLEKRQIKEWNYMRLLRSLADPNDRGAREAAGLEYEASRAVAKRDDKTPKGAFIPNEILNRKVLLDESDFQRALRMSPDYQSALRTAQVGDDTYGGYLVASGPQGQSFIEYLHNNMKVKELGATILPGLRGDFEVAIQTGGLTYYMVGEDVDVTASTLTWGDVKMAPKTIGCHTKVTRKALLQTSPAVEQVTMAEQAMGLALGIDYYSLHGTGVSSQPLGIAKTTGVGATGAIGTNGGAITYAKLVDCEGDVIIANAAKPRMAMLTNGRVRREASQIVEHATLPVAQWIWGRTSDPLVGSMLGYPAHVSEQVSHTLTKGTSTSVCSAVFFGDWTQLWIGEWGTVDVNVDTATYSSSGAIKVVTLQDFDVALRHPESFSVIPDVTTA